MIKIYEEKSLTLLADSLFNELSNKVDFFKPTKIVFPNKDMEYWFKSNWLKNKNTVLMNVQYYSLEEGLKDLFYNSKNMNLVSQSDLFNFILKVLLDDIDEDKLSLDKIIKDFIYEDIDNKKISNTRVFDLSTQLASLFIEYELDQIDITSWQKNVYLKVNELFKKHYCGTLNYYYKNFNFKSDKDTIYFFGFPSFNDLRNLYKNIINDASKFLNIHFYSLTSEKVDNFDHISLVGAPSKLREIEWLHGEICKLIRDKKVHLSDILVLSKNIQDYEVEINRVFKQDDEQFPNIPFVIKGSNKKQGDIYNALVILFNVVNKGFFSRLDIYELLNLPLVAKVRGLTKEDLEKYFNLIISQNVFRNRNSTDDWDYIKKKLLLSKISDVNLDEPYVELGGRKSYPYASIGLDDNLIIKFVNIIDDIREFINLMNDFTVLNKEKIEKITANINKWFSIYTNGIQEKNSTLKNINAFLYDLNVLEIYSPYFDLDLFRYCLLATAKEKVSSHGESFTSGVSFLNFKEGIVYSNKYVFFIGLNSTSLPSVLTKSELDIRDYIYDKASYERKTFNNQIINSLEHLYLSYINLDLINNEKLYKSSFILDILDKNPSINETTIGLDENRPYSELFTRKEFKNKGHFSNIYISTPLSISSVNNIYEYFTKIKVSDMKDFLTEPFSYKFKKIYSTYSDFEEEMQQEYEPLEIDLIESSKIFKKILLTALNTNNDETAVKEALDELKVEFESSNLITDELSVLIDSVVEVKKNDIFATANSIKNITNDTHFETYIPKDKTFFYKNIEWTLSSKNEVIRSVNEDTYSYFELKHFAKKLANREFLRLYITSLLDVVSFSDGVYNIKLYRSENPQEFVITPNEAKEILLKIYEKMHDFKDMKYAYIDLDLTKFDDFITFETKLRDKTFDNGWKYFDGKVNLDLKKDIGYDPENFTKDDVKAAINENAKLILFIKKQEENNG